MASKTPLDEELRAHVARYFEQLYRPGHDQFHNIVHIDAGPDGLIAFSGPVFASPGGFPVSRLGLVDRDRTLRLLGDGTSSDSQPKWSPDGRQLAFLSDRAGKPGHFQLYLLDPVSGTITAGPRLASEIVESLVWSFDGQRLLLQSAMTGADAAGSQSGMKLDDETEGRPDWAPHIEDGTHDRAWRLARVLDLKTGDLTVIGQPGLTVWEAAWCGADEIVAITSASPTEGGWYQSQLSIAPAAGGAFTTFAEADVELAGVAGTPDGRHVAVIAGRFHRTVQLGALRLYDRATGESVPVPGIDTEVSALAWRNSCELFFTGVRTPDTIAGTLNIETGEVCHHWQSLTTFGRKVPLAAPEGGAGFVFGGQAPETHPFVGRLTDDGAALTVLDLGHEGAAVLARAFASVEPLSWAGRDGLEIRGYLARPSGAARPPLVTFIHGGPSHLWRSSWVFDNPLTSLLVYAGYAVFFPNPRGSSGRGQDYASRVLGDWGGEDTHDILLGIDHVVGLGSVDPTRLLVIGGSYGGYMTSWLVGQTDRFAAACAISPVSDLRSQYFTAHHPEFMGLYTGDSPYRVGGAFDARSPIMHAHRVKTPTLVIAGGADMTTPASQALEFHRALVLEGVPSELVVYPGEGHAVARYEAQIDQGTRVLAWFERFAPGPQ